MASVLKRLEAMAAALLIACALCLFGCTSAQPSGESSSDASSSATASATDGSTPSVTVTEDGKYTDKDRVAAYIHEFGHLPSNYISKTKARKAGWDNTKDNLWDVCPGMSIGGGPFYNDEGFTTMRACCPMRKTGTGRNATSTTKVATAEPNASCSPTTASSSTRPTITSPSSSFIQCEK